MHSPRKKSSAKPSAHAESASVMVANDASPQDPVRELQQSVGNQAFVSLLSAGVIQRKAKDSESGSAPAESTAERSPVNTGPSLIVEDDAQDLKPGQMRKSEFLSQLRSAACSAAEQALAGTMWSTMGCPHIERWLEHYSRQPSAYLERALRKYVPEAANVRSAQEYLPLVTQKLKRGIEQWRTTGETPADLPEEFRGGEMPGMTVSGLVGGLLTGIGSAVSGVVSGIGSAIGGALSSVGSMLFKHREGSSESGTGQEPEQIRSQLGSGHSLEGGVQRRMHSAFGVDFSGVRVHTDSPARELSEGFGARAFTIGNDIAFGADEYQPGTPVGDALIAHELAHVVQQGGDSAATTAQHKGGDASGALEEDADRSAVGAVVKLWTGARGELTQLGHNATPRLRSGLRLQGCGGAAKETKPTGQPVALSGDWAKDVDTAKKNKDEAMMLALVKKALGPKFDVNLATQTSSEQEDPKDYKKAPAINFDPNLSNKKKYKKEIKVGENPGHSFDVGNDTYAIIGEGALKPSSPLNTVMYAEHELYHTTHHLGPNKKKPDPEDRKLTKEERARKKAEEDAGNELETWTLDFTKFFHLLGRIVPKGTRYEGPLWGPLIGYYKDSNATARAAALKQIVDYYKKPPSGSGGVPDHPTTPEKVKDVFKAWLENDKVDQTAQLVQDLKTELKL